MPGSGPDGHCGLWPGRRSALHVRMADEAYRIESDRAIPYLDIPALIAIACRAKAHLVHPGYGFLAENATLLRSAHGPGLLSSGRRRAHRAMGDKLPPAHQRLPPACRSCPGRASRGGREAARAWARRRRVSRCAEGGGRRRRRGSGWPGERGPDRLYRVAPRVRPRVVRDGRMYLSVPERPRHVEVQVFADSMAT